MRAVVFNGELTLADVPAPQPETGEALVRVLKAGVCKTDLEIVRGYLGFRGILGHDFVGVVEDANNRDIVGRRVVGEINCVCHRCALCQMELPQPVDGFRCRGGGVAFSAPTRCRARATNSVLSRTPSYALVLSRTPSYSLVLPPYPAGLK